MNELVLRLKSRRIFGEYGNADVADGLPFKGQNIPDKKGHPEK
jgi:hypothetical protein